MTDAPIFILACSPRTGSTWLQRVITSTKDALIWGECVQGVAPMGDLWTTDEPVGNDLHEFEEKKTAMFMATLLPHKNKMLHAYKRLSDELYGKEAELLGYTRWGKKETEWTNDIVNFILAMWPNAKIIFLVREFDRVYSSAFRTYAAPRERPDTTRAFEMCKYASVWTAHLRWAFTFVQANSRCRLYRYEDLYVEETPDLKVIQDMLTWLGIAKQPNWGDASQEISMHKWGDRDIRSYRPCDLDILWPYRDDILEFSRKLGYSQVLGVTV